MPKAAQAVGYGFDQLCIAILEQTLTVGLIIWLNFLHPCAVKPRAAISSIHEKPPSPKQKMVNAGGWILLLIAFAVLAIGLYGLYKVMTDATVAQLQIVGTNSDVENQQLAQHFKSDY